MTPAAGLQPVPGHRLIELRGTGAFSEVWESCREDGKHLAFKFLDCRKLSPALIASEVKLLRSLNELNHANIVPFLGVHTWGRYLILMMELAQGSLRDMVQDYRVRTGQLLPNEIALSLLEQAANALDFLASARTTGSRTRGLQHCDIKPSNLLILGDRLKVADFGLAAASGLRTHTGWKGTLPYAAPELFRGAAAPGTDQYALAITYCEVVLGERAFYPGDFKRAAQGESPIDLTKLREREFPVIARALHAYPSARWPSCREFIGALRAACQSARKVQPLPAATTQAPTRKRSFGR